MQRNKILKRLAQYSRLLTILLFCSTFGYAQGFSVESKSPPKPAGTETFTSLDSRFSIALPKQISGYNPKSLNTPNGHVEIVTYDWKTAEGVFQVGYTERTIMLESASKTVLTQIRNSILAGVGSKGKLISETDISLNEHPGREMKIDFSDSLSIARFYIVRSRVYQVIASLPAVKKDEEPAAIKILDSFKVLTQDEVEAAVKKQIEEATPKSLPQEPIAKKLKSDAEDKGLKGKIKTVFTEEEDLSGTWMVNKRKPSSTEYYNEQSNLTKEESYDYRGNLASIEVYGYLDGDRVSDEKSIEHEYNPPPMLIAAAPGKSKPTKYDKRFTFKYKYKYDNKGNLKEDILYDNGGKLVTRTVYNLKSNQKEKLVYAEDGSLNQKYFYTLDDKGNEMEETSYNTNDNSIENKYSYTYEFDSHGNWIKQTTSKLDTKDGKSSIIPYSVTYRTVTYY